MYEHLFHLYVETVFLLLGCERVCSVLKVYRVLLRVDSFLLANLPFLRLLTSVFLDDYNEEEEEILFVQTPTVARMAMEVAMEMKRKIYDVTFPPFPIVSTPTAMLTATTTTTTAQKTQLTCSVGIGPCRMIAKMAAEVNKPDGVFRGNRIL